jgi:hypothetical protein
MGKKQAAAAGIVHLNPQRTMPRLLGVAMSVGTANPFLRVIVAALGCCKRDFDIF